MGEDDAADKRVIIIGAGPAGLSAAYELSKSGVASQIIEKDSQVGGLSKTVRHNDFYFDLGGHRFYTKVEWVEDTWKEVLGGEFRLCKRLSRIFYQKKYFYYPLRPLNALFGLGIWKSILIILSYLHSHCFPLKEEKSLEQWVSNRFGKRLYRTFFKTYTEKVWGIPCSEIRAEWAAQRIKGLSLLTVVKNSLLGTPGNGMNKGPAIKTLIEEFHYPRLGPGMMWQRFVEILRQSGSRVSCNTSVERIFWADGRVQALEVRRNGRTERISGTDFISSMPLGEAIQKFDPPAPRHVLEAAAELRYRDFITVALVINRSDLFKDNWIYVHDPDVKVGRIQNYKNWSQDMVPNPGKTCLGFEYFCSVGDSLWQLTDEELVGLAKQELQALGLGCVSDVEDGAVVRVRKAYPIYDGTYETSVTVLRQFLASIGNFQVVGRNGMHKYNNQDHSMLTAMLASQNILGMNHDLWKVNVDRAYQEEIHVESAKPRAADLALIKAFSRIDKPAFATAAGTVSAFLLTIATMILILKEGDIVGPYLALLGQFFPGYKIDVQGMIIGAGYAFLSGFLLGWAFAYLRNLLTGYYIYRAKRQWELLSFSNYFDHF